MTSMTTTIFVVLLIFTIMLPPVIAKFSHWMSKKRHSRTRNILDNVKVERIVRVERIIAETAAKPVVKFNPIPPNETVILPADDEAMCDLLKSYKKQSIVFPRQLPPHHPVTSLSFFGGTPVVPPDWTWPRGRATGLPLIFMGQIDISTIPQGEVRDGLPPDGVLYFFSPTAGEWVKEREGDQDDAVLYAPGPTTGWQSEIVPEDMPVNPAYRLRRAQASSGSYAPFAKWQVTPTPMTMYPDHRGWVENDRYLTFDLSQRNDAEYYYDDPVWNRVCGELSRAEWTRVFGEKKVESAKDQQPATNGIDALPPVWLGLRIFCAAILERLVEARQPAPEFGDEMLTRRARLGELANEILARAETEDQLARVPADQTAKFANLWGEVEVLTKIRPSVNENYRYLIPFGMFQDAQNDAIDQTIEACLSHSAETAALISPEQVAHVRRRIGHRAHWMGGYPSSIQEAGDEYAPDHFLLMEFGDDPGIGWGWGESLAIQYWISHQDLADRQFHKVFITVEST